MTNIYQIRKISLTFLLASILIVFFQNCSSSKPKQTQNKSESTLGNDDENDSNPLLPPIENDEDDDGDNDGGDDGDSDDPGAGNQVPSSFYGWWMSPSRSEIVHFSQNGEVLVFLEDFNTTNNQPLCGFNSTITHLRSGMGYYEGKIDLRDANSIGIRKVGEDVETTHSDNSFCATLVKYKFKLEGSHSLCVFADSESECSSDSLSLKKVSLDNTTPFLKRWVLADDTNFDLDLRLDGGAGVLYWAQNQCLALAFVGGVLEGNNKKAVLHIVSAIKNDPASAATCEDLNGSFDLEIVSNQLKAKARSGKALQIFGTNTYILK